MGLISVPVLNGIAGKNNTNKHCVSFAYKFAGDTPKLQNLFGQAFLGVSYTLDVSSLSTSVANLGPFRTMQLSCSFSDKEPGGVVDYDGELFVQIDGTGQFFRFGSLPVPATTEVPQSFVTACVPIVSNAPSKIIFTKRVADDNVNMFGLLQCSIFDFDLPPFTIGGVSYANNDI